MNTKQFLNLSGIELVNSDITFTMATNKTEAAQLYMEAASWLQVNPDGNLSDPEDTSEDWKIQPMCVIDPKLHEEWKKARLWMMDPLDDALGDDAMPALCSSCNGVFWGDQMMSIVKTITRLRAKHNGSINGMLGNAWEEAEPNVIDKLRVNRMCKKCYTVSVEALANPWRENNYSSVIQIPNVQPNLPFPTIDSSFQPMTASGMAIPAGSWNISYTDSNGSYIADCVSDTYTTNKDENDI